MVTGANGEGQLPLEACFARLRRALPDLIG